MRAWFEIDHRALPCPPTPPPVPGTFWVRTWSRLREFLGRQYDALGRPLHQVSKSPGTSWANGKFCFFAFERDDKGGVTKVVFKPLQQSVPVDATLTDLAWPL